MIFTRSATRQSSTKLDCNQMSLLQGIEEYMEVLNQAPQEKEYEIQRICMELFYQYCKIKNHHTLLLEVQEEVFYQFLLYWIPKESKALSYETAREILDNLLRFSQYISEKYESNLWKMYEKVYGELVDELPRIIQVKREFGRYLGNPVVNWNPLVIDLNFYKKKKNKKTKREKGQVFEQGYFEVIEVSDNHSVILKKKWGYDLYVKIIIDDHLLQYLRNHDILHMRLKRRMFFTCWDIEDVKSCYLSPAQKYIKTKA